MFFVVSGYVLTCTKYGTKPAVFRSVKFETGGEHRPTSKSSTIEELLSWTEINIQYAEFAVYCIRLFKKILLYFYSTLLIENDKQEKFSCELRRFLLKAKTLCKTTCVISVDN